MAGGGSDEFCRGWQLLAELANEQRSIFARRTSILAECLGSLVGIGTVSAALPIQPQL